MNTGPRNVNMRPWNVIIGLLNVNRGPWNVKIGQ